MTLILEDPQQDSASLSFLVRTGGGASNVACWVPLTSTSPLHRVSCRDLSHFDSAPFSLYTTIDRISIHNGYLVHLDISSATDSEFYLSGFPVVSGAQRSYLLSMASLSSIGERLVRDKEQEVAMQMATSENSSTPPTLSSNSPMFYTGPRIVGIVLGSVVFAAIVAALIVTMVVSARRSPGPSTDTTVPLIVLPSGESSKDVVVDTASSSKVVIPSASSTLSTQSSPSLLASLPVAAGVISASLSSTTKGSLSMSPPLAETPPLHGGVVGHHTSAGFMRGSPKTISHLGGTPGSSPHGAPIGATNSNSIAIGTSSRGRKTEKVALADSLFISPRPPRHHAGNHTQTSNAALASLPAEPAPKVKARYLACNQHLQAQQQQQQQRQQQSMPASLANIASSYVLGAMSGSSGGSGTLSVKHAPRRKNVKYAELLGLLQQGSRANGNGTFSKASHGKKRHDGGDAVNDDDDADYDDDEPEEESKKRTREEILDDEGVPGFWTDEDDTWLQDIVEPEPNDPVYKNDETFTPINLRTLALVPDAGDDASIPPLDSHLASLASPLQEVAIIPMHVSKNKDKKKKKKKNKRKSSKDTDKKKHRKTKDEEDIVDDEDKVNEKEDFENDKDDDNDDDGGDDDEDDEDGEDVVKTRKTRAFATSPPLQQQQLSTPTKNQGGIQLSKSSEFIPAKKPSLNPALLLDASTDDLSASSPRS